MNTKPNLKAIIEKNLDKTGHIPSKGQSTLPKGGWLDSYKSGGQPCYNCGGMYKQGGSYASSWMLTNPKPAPVSFPRMDNGGDISIPNLEEGDWLSRYQGGGSTTIGTTRPPKVYTDYAEYIKAKQNYDDSLFLHNINSGQINKLKSADALSWKKHVDDWFNKGYLNKITNASKRLKNAKPVKTELRKFDNYYDPETSNYYTALATAVEYKKPVQPVVYQKPKPKPKPKPELKNQSEPEEQIDRIEGYDITSIENKKKIIPEPKQDKTDYLIQSLDKEGKQKVKYFNSKKEKDEYDAKLSKDFNYTRKTDNSSVYTAVLPEFQIGGQEPLPKLGSREFYSVRQNQKSDNTTVFKKPRKLSEQELKELDEIREKQEKNRFAKNSNYTKEELTTREKRTSESDEHRRKLNKRYANTHGGYVNKYGDYVQGLGNDAADTKIANRTYDNIVEPLINVEMVMSGVGALGKGALKVATETGGKQLLKKGEKEIIENTTKNSYKSSTSQRTPWLDIPNPNYNLNSKNKFLENRDFGKMESGVVKGDPSTEESIMKNLFPNKPKENFKSELDWLKGYKQGGVITDPRGQWAHPGKRTIVPTPTGQITMQGVPYPVYGQDETGYGQMMYPEGEYQFPGKMVYEKPMMQKGGWLNQYK